MSGRPDRQLVSRLRDREEAAFKEMVRKYRDRVFHVVYRIVGDEEEAEDVAQEVFIAVFKNIDSFRGDAKFSTWLFRIASNRAKNRVKYLARRHRQSHQDLDDTPESNIDANPVGGDTDRPDERAMGRELEDVVQRGLRELDEKYRDVVVLRDIEDLTYDEMAEALDVPEGTIKSRLYRARSKLKAFVEENYHGGDDDE